MVFCSVNFLVDNISLFYLNKNFESASASLSSQSIIYHYHRTVNEQFSSSIFIYLLCPSTNYSKWQINGLINVLSSHLIFVQFNFYSIFIQFLFNSYSTLIQLLFNSYSTLIHSIQFLFNWIEFLFNSILIRVCMIK